MAGGSPFVEHCRAAGLALAVLLVSGWGSAGDLTPPTLQEIQVAGRVLHFQETPVSGPVIVAVVYNAAARASHDEAAALAALLGNGVLVGDLILRPRLVEQGHLAEANGYGAIFVTIDVDDGLLSASLRQHRVLCLTRHLEQVEHGSCTVAITSEPVVSIVVNAANAGIAGVRFATAFRMMVREI
jgi:hypothetical protein